MTTEIELREVSRDRATEEIIRFVRAHPHSDSFDIAVALRIDFDLADAICEDLVAQGRFAS